MHESVGEENFTEYADWIKKRLPKKVLLLLLCYCCTAAVLLLHCCCAGAAWLHGCTVVVAQLLRCCCTVVAVALSMCLFTTVQPPPLHRCCTVAPLHYCSLLVGACFVATDLTGLFHCLHWRWQVDHGLLNDHATVTMAPTQPPGARWPMGTNDNNLEYYNKVPT